MMFNRDHSLGAKHSHSSLRLNDGRGGVFWCIKAGLGLFLALLLNIQAAHALPDPATSTPIKITMRDHGYTLGDLIFMHVEFSLKKGLAFDPESVPLKGSVNAWLDLREVAMREGKNADDSSHVSIDFTWQVFGTVEHAQVIKIPAIFLQTLPPEVANSKPMVITIPAQGFHLSPVLPPALTENKHRAHAPPLRFDTQTPLISGLVCMGLSLLCGAVWLWLQDKIPWCPRNPGPMTQLSRQLRRQQVAQSFSMAHLRSIHAALAGSAGQSLYPDTLHRLFEQCPYLLANQAEISQFFDASWRLFHEKNTSADNISVAETMRWINRSAMAERLSRRQSGTSVKHPLAARPALTGKE